MPGKYVENLSGDAKYLFYKPNALPNVLFLKLDDEAVELLVKATSAISALDIKASMIPNRDKIKRPSKAWPLVHLTGRRTSLPVDDLFVAIKLKGQAMLGLWCT